MRSKSSPPERDPPGPSRDATVYLLDDEEPSLKVLSEILATIALKTERFTTARDFLQRDLSGLRGCVVVDLRMPEYSGFDVLAALRRARSPAPAIIISAHGDVGVAVRAMKAGAVDFLEKPFRPQALLDAVDGAIRIYEANAALLVTSSDVERRLDSLSQREREILEHVFRGRSTKEIATELGLSGYTVDNHRCRIMKKMESASLVDLVRDVSVSRLVGSLSLPLIRG